MPPIPETLAARNAAVRVVAPCDFNCFIVYWYKENGRSRVLTAGAELLPYGFN